MSYLMESSKEGQRLVQQERANPSSVRLLQAGLRRGERVADLGCGSGAVMPAILDLVGPEGWVTGVDLSPERVEEARRLLGPARNAEVRLGALPATGLPEASFDFTWSQFVFEYLREPEAALREMIRVTRPGGRVAVADVDGIGLAFWPRPAVLEEGTEPFMRALSATGFDFFIGRKLFTLFRQAGLADVSVHLSPLYVSAGARCAAGGRLHAALRGAHPAGRQDLRRRAALPPLRRCLPGDAGRPGRAQVRGGVDRGGTSRAMTDGDARQWDRPEVGARLLKTLLLSFEKKYGRERLEALWRERPMPLSLEYLAEPNHFVSLDFLELLCDELVRGSGDPDFMTNAGRNIATPEALGFAYYFLRGFGTPGLAYRKAVEASPTYNRAGEFRIERSTPWSMTLTYRSKRAERNRQSCLGRMANYAAFPTIWGLPEAKVVERQCQVNGADCCRYDFTWQNPHPGLWRRWLGAGLGAVLSVVAARLRQPGLSELLPCLTIAGFAFGAWLDLKRLAVQKDALLAQTTQGMQQSAAELQERAEQAFRTNVELDQRVTERTSELTAALERLRQLDALKSEFFANVSHELRTPLTLILAPLDDRLGHSVTPEERRLLEGLRRNAQRLLRLIDDLLDLSRIDAGQLRLDLAAIDLGAMIRQLKAVFSSAAEARGLTLVMEGPETTSEVWGDAHRLDSALSNLLGNAFKFTPAGGTVTLRVEETPDQVRVTVRDTGPGISPADQLHIFERYYQADEHGARKAGGVGIGLALARNLVELHGGRLEVSSQPGYGAAFTMTLLRGKEHFKPEVLERRRVQVEVPAPRRASDVELETNQHAPFGPAPRPNPATPRVIFDGGRRARVLVVEDNPDVRAMLVELLSPTLEVAVAADGAAALELVKRDRPDLVLSDVMMPVMRGTELCAAIKADPVLAATPVILLTARGGTDAAIEGFAAGADEFVEKPFHPRVLVARVQAQLRLRALSLQLNSQARLAAVGTLAAGVGHEVRNPVNAVLNGVRALQARSGLDVSDQQLLEVIADGAERINQISGALLSHVSPGDGGGQRPVDARAGLDSTLRLMEHRLTGIKVHRDYATDALVVASAAELNQIFLNLIDNGIRAPAKNLWVSVREAGDKVHICVADDGPGVPAQVAPRLFDPFFTTRPPGEGTGLGLYLSKQSLLRWGGDLKFADRAGGGTSFTVELPREPR